MIGISSLNLKGFRSFMFFICFLQQSILFGSLDQLSTFVLTNRFEIFVLFCWLCSALSAETMAGYSISSGNIMLWYSFESSLLEGSMIFIFKILIISFQCQSLPRTAARSPSNQPPTDYYSDPSRTPSYPLTRSSTASLLHPLSSSINLDQWQRPPPTPHPKLENLHLMRSFIHREPMLTILHLSIEEFHHSLKLIAATMHQTLTPFQPQSPQHRLEGVHQTQHLLVPRLQNVESAVKAQLQEFWLGRSSKSQLRVWRMQHYWWGSIAGFKGSKHLGEWIGKETPKVQVQDEQVVGGHQNIRIRKYLHAEMHLLEIHLHLRHLHQILLVPGQKLHTPSTIAVSLYQKYPQILITHISPHFRIHQQMQMPLNLSVSTPGLVDSNTYRFLFKIFF